LDESDGVGVSDDETFGVWSEIRCIDQGLTSGCLGRPVGSSDAWVWVARDCDIDDLAIPVTKVWQGSSCANGGSPDNFFPEHRCGSLGDLSVCWSGGDGWFTQTIPTCELDIKGHAVGDQWPDWHCGGSAGSISVHPWGDVACSPIDSSACLGVTNASAEMMLPTCWVDQWTEVEPPDC